MTYLKTATILFIGIAFMVVSSCKKNRCESQYCLNGGTCVDGYCQCPTNYTGTHCETYTGGGGGGTCYYTSYSGTQNCTTSGYVAVSSQYCCPSSSPYYGFETSYCYASCSAAKSAGNTNISYGTGQGGGGGGGTGNALFWVSSDLGCGYVTVSLNGYSDQITNYNSTSPACGTSGCAEFTLSPGTYSYSASCGSYTWSGSITITSGGCSKMRLYI